MKTDWYVVKSGNFYVRISTDRYQREDGTVAEEKHISLHSIDRSPHLKTSTKEEVVEIRSMLMNCEVYRVHLELQSPYPQSFQDWYRHIERVLQVAGIALPDLDHSYYISLYESGIDRDEAASLVLEKGRE